MADPSLSTASVIDQFLSEYLGTSALVAQGPEPKPSNLKQPTHIPGKPKAGPKRLARCLAAFEAEGEGEMTLAEGDIVIVEELNEDGWWLGSCNGKRGYFAGSFVEVIGDRDKPKTLPNAPGGAPVPPVRSRTASIADSKSKKILPTPPPKTAVTAPALALAKPQPLPPSKPPALALSSSSSSNAIIPPSPSSQTSSIASTTPTSASAPINPLSSKDGKKEATTPRSYSSTSLVSSNSTNSNSSNSSEGDKEKKSTTFNPVGQLFRRLPPVPLFGLSSRKDRGSAEMPVSAEGVPLEVDDPNKPDYKRPARVPSRVQEVIVQESKKVVLVERANSFLTTGELPPRKNITPGPELDTRRSFIVKEILSTEKTYVDSLTMGLEKYMAPMKAMAKAQQELAAKEPTANDEVPVVSGESVQKMFGNMEAILSLNRDLYSKLKSRVDEWTPQSTIGDLFKKFAPFFKMYTTYSNNYDTAINTMDEATEAGWLEKFVRYTTLESILITPVQRIPRYQLLLQELWLHTPDDHLDFAELTAALKLIKETAVHINTMMNNLKNMERLTEEGFGWLLYESAGRSLVMDVEIEVLASQWNSTRLPVRDRQRNQMGFFKFLLFNDILVHYDDNATSLLGVGKRKKKGETAKKGLKPKKKPEKGAKEVGPNKKALYIWPLELIHLRDTGSKTGFDLTGPDKIMSIMIAEGGGGPEAKQALWESLKAGIDRQIRHVFESHRLAQSIEGKSDFALNLAERYGRYEFIHGEVYTGRFLNGELQGQGTLDYFGTSYSGHFEKGQKIGVAKIAFSDGSIYVGATESGMPHGYGEFATEGGDSYVGEWKAGKRHGVGDAIWSCGDSFVGDWFDGQMQGFGYLKCSNGFSYDGIWKDGQFHGRGTLISIEGEFTGQFDMGVKSGPGMMKYKDDSVFDGLWRDDKWHGAGVHSSDVGIYTGDFVRGKREGRGEMIFNDVSAYVGPWKDDRPSGPGGVFINPNGNEIRYEGDWDNGKRHGKATLAFHDGTSYEGGFANNKMHGHGKMTLSNHTIISGKWVNGVHEGRSNVTNPEEASITVDSNKDEASGADWLVVPFLPFHPRAHVIDY